MRGNRNRQYREDHSEPYRQGGRWTDRIAALRDRCRRQDHRWEAGKRRSQKQQTMTQRNCCNLD